jgi:hypothetical protein
MRRLLILVVAGIVMGCSSAASSALPAEPTKSLATGTTTPTAAVTPTVAVTPTAAPTISAAACTGTDADRAKLVEAASQEPFAVYCAVLPPGWQVSALLGPVANGVQTVEIKYASTGGLSLTILELAGGPTLIPPDATRIGVAHIGDLTGDLYVGVGGGVYMIFATPDAARRYLIAGSLGISKDQLTTWAAAFVRVG